MQKNNINIIKQNAIIKKILNNSIDNNVAHLRDKTFEFLLNKIDELKIKNCLEIGSGVGYSACILNLYKNIKIITIEKSVNRYDNLIKNLKDFVDIKCINEDCFKYDTKQLFDLIIIDGPKIKQIDLIKKFKKNLTKNGIIFIDNVFLKKFSELSNPNKNQLKILNEINKLQNYLNNYENNKCKIYNIDDGIAIIYK